jgi:hypothetical protein
MLYEMNSLKARQLDAEERANRYLATFNELDEAGYGKTPRAQEVWRKGQYWLDRLNKLLGNA